MTLQELQSKIKSASDKMRSDDNTKNALRYLEQLTWLLFLKQWDEMENERELIATVDGRTYQRVLDGAFRWSQWTNGAMTGETLVRWVNDDLLPHLRSLTGSVQREQIARLFESVTTVMKSGYSLLSVIEIVDTIDLHDIEEHHAMSVIYETLLAQTADAGWSGEFYTPRPVVEAMVDIVAPRLGETLYDPCSGSAGFLVVGAERLLAQVKTTEDDIRVREQSVFGQESGDLAYFVGTMNLMLHGVDSPQTVRRNTLEENARNLDPSSQHDVILTNPPFGGTENPQVQQNFPSKSAATELLFLQHCMAKLALGGRAAIVLPDGILYRAENAFSTVRRRLMQSFNVTGIVRLPPGVFPTARDVRTNIIFFDRSEEKATAVRYYQVLPGEGRRAFSKLSPIQKADLDGAQRWLRDGVPDPQSWEVSLDDLRLSGWDLDVPWPGAGAVGNGENAPERLAAAAARAQTIAEILTELSEIADSLDGFATEAPQVLGPWIVERGSRASAETPDVLKGVSNTGGMAPFKGKPAADMSRYRKVEPGDFVYNPMRVDVGSIALCSRTEDAGWVSPDYVVFALNDAAPFNEEYLLTYLKSEIGRAEITRRSRGAVRRRLYYTSLENVLVPVPKDGDAWEAVLNGLASVRRHLRELPVVAKASLEAMEQSLFAVSDQD